MTRLDYILSIKVGVVYSILYSLILFQEIDAYMYFVETGRNDYDVVTAVCQGSKMVGFGQWKARTSPYR